MPMYSSLAFRVLVMAVGRCTLLFLITCLFPESFFSYFLYNLCCCFFSNVLLNVCPLIRFGRAELKSCFSIWQKLLSEMPIMNTISPGMVCTWFLVFGFKVYSSTSLMLAWVLLDLMCHVPCWNILILLRPFLSCLLQLLPVTYSQTICKYFFVQYFFCLYVALYQHPITERIFYICHINSLT